MKTTRGEIRTIAKEKTIERKVKRMTKPGHVKIVELSPQARTISGRPANSCAIYAMPNSTVLVENEDSEATCNACIATTGLSAGYAHMAGHKEALGSHASSSTSTPATQGFEILILLKQQTAAAALEVEREDGERPRVVRKRTENESEENEEEQELSEKQRTKKKKNHKEKSLMQTEN